jgi:hypothetical protein
MDEDQMNHVIIQLEEAAQQIAEEHDESELIFWQQFAQLLENAIAHLEQVYQERCSEQDLICMMSDVQLQ